MAKTVTAPKPRTSAKPPPKRKSHPDPIIDAAEEKTPPPPTLLDKTFVLQIILAKLESAKNFDWFALSQKLGAVPTDVAMVKGRKKKDEGKAWTGGELQDLYQSTILPALKSGRPLWADDAIASDLLALPPTPPPTVKTIAQDLSPISTPALKDPIKPAKQVKTAKNSHRRSPEVEERAASEADVEGTAVVSEEDEDREVEPTFEDLVRSAQEEKKQEREELESESPDMEEIAVEVEFSEVPGITGRSDDSDENEEPAAKAEKAGKKVTGKKLSPKLATTYGKKISAVPPSLGQRQPAAGKAGAAGTKRIRPAYSDEEDEDEDERPDKASKPTSKLPPPTTNKKQSPSKIKPAKAPATTRPSATQPSATEPPSSMAPPSKPASATVSKPAHAAKASAPKTTSVRKPSPPAVRQSRARANAKPTSYVELSDEEQEDM